MVDVARTATAAQLDRLVAGHRQIDRQTPDHRSGGDGSAEPPVDDGGWSQRCYRQRDRGGWPAVRADAAIELSGGSTEACQVELDIDLTITMPADAHPADVDPTGTATLVTEARLPTEVTRRYGCDGSVRLTAANHSIGEGQTPAIGVGRRTKVVPRWLRRRLERRDNHTCRFPTCTSTRRLHAHHIVHWADFGATDLDNLVLLCSFHHHLVHEGGWTLTGTATNNRITRPDGTRLSAAAVNCHDASTKRPELDSTTVADPSGLFAQAGVGERYDHNYVVDVVWTVNDHQRKRFRGTVAGGRQLGGHVARR